MNKDPRWITARYGSYCHKCRKYILKGQTIWYYPGPKYVMCSRDDCGAQAARDFVAARNDEKILNGRQYGFSF